MEGIEGKKGKMGDKEYEKMSEKENKRGERGRHGNRWTKEGKRRRVKKDTERVRGRKDEGRKMEKTRAREEEV